jgi:hypothetical protein
MTNFLAWAKASYIREKRIINLHTSGTHFEHAYTIISKVGINKEKRFHYHLG